MRRELLSPQVRAALFDPPTDPQEIVRHYTFAPDDLALIQQRRRPRNRLGFAVCLGYMRYPGRFMETGEVPPPEMLNYIAEQLQFSPPLSSGYAAHEETRREHLLELCAYLGVRPFSRRNLRAMFETALQTANGTKPGRGDCPGDDRKAPRIFDAAAGARRA